MCLIDDADGSVTLLHRREHKAKLKHKCSECKRIINPGETYLSERYVFDRAATSSKVCSHCRVVRSYLIIHCRGWIYGHLREDMLDHYYSTLSNDKESRRIRLLRNGIQSKWRTSQGRLWPVPPMETE